MLTAIEGDVRIVDVHKHETLGASVFSPVMPAGTVKFLMVQALTQNIRFTLSNGQIPSATMGFQLVAGDFPVLIPMGTAFTPQFFRETSGAILEYQWLG